MSSQDPGRDTKELASGAPDEAGPVSSTADRKPKQSEEQDKGYAARQVDVAAQLAHQGQLHDALAQRDLLLAVEPENSQALHDKGLLLNQLGRREEAIVALQRATGLSPDNAIFANNLAVVLSDAGRRDEALGEFERALALYPGNIQIEHQIRRLRSEMVPFWHIPMLNDHRRNDAFEDAIKAAIAARGTDVVVLDIGTGSGLLSLMAARAGAGTVVACEIVPVIARTARKIVAESGFGERIAIHEQSSTSLEVGRHLPRRADILVSEILSSDLLTEKVLDTFEDAHRRLLAEDAVVIPRSATAVGCLVASKTLADYVHVGEVSGFDLSHFNDLGPMKLPIHGTMTDWQRLSGDMDLVSVDLRERAHGSSLQHLAIPVTADGDAIGVVQWMRVDLAEGVSFDNHPEGYSDGGWLQVLHRFSQPIRVKTGDVLNMAVGHDRTTLIIAPFVPQAPGLAI